MLATAIALAANKHMGQFDKAGVPYILHCLKVMHYLKTDDQELMSIAVLHDILEDTDVKPHELRDMGFSNRVQKGVLCMTKWEGMDAHAYMVQLLSNPDSVKVKLADLRHNSDIRRLKGITEKDVERMKKYHAMYLQLKAADLAMTGPMLQA